MESIIRTLLQEIAENNLSEEALQNTPKRLANALKAMTNGYSKTLEETVGNGIFPAPGQDWILVKDISISSLCEHHLLPFTGVCNIGYLPNQHILGLSKLARITELYAHRLQLQEKLTQEIGKAIMQAIQPKAVGVAIKAQHTCMMSRGVKQTQASMTTYHMLGLNEDDPMRCELLQKLTPA